LLFLGLHLAGASGALVAAAGAEGAGHASASAGQRPPRISGTVTDALGQPIVGATISLENAASHNITTTVSDDHGSFAATPPEAGTFSMTIRSDGFAPVVTTGLLVPDGQEYHLAPVTMLIAIADEIEVKAPLQHELAQQQIKAEEKQRVFSILPNFYVSYVPNPAPLTAKQKLALALRTTVDPTNFAVNGLVAGIEQWWKYDGGYGQGVEGYGKRYGAAVGDTVSGVLIGAGVLPAVLRQDPRYFYKGEGTVPSRIAYALLTVVRTKGDNGRWQPNYSGFLGELAAAAISNSYRAHSDRLGATSLVNTAAIGVALEGAGALIQEFVVRKITTHANDRGTVQHE
jgi:hypothetical protein